MIDVFIIDDDDNEDNDDDDDDINNDDKIYLCTRSEVHSKASIIDFEFNNNN